MHRFFKRNLCRDVWGTKIPSRYRFLKCWNLSIHRVQFIANIWYCAHRRPPDESTPRSGNETRNKSCFERPAFTFARGTHHCLAKAFRTPENWRRTYNRLSPLKPLSSEHCTNVLAGIYFWAITFGMLSLIDTVFGQERSIEPENEFVCSYGI